MTGAARKVADVSADRLAALHAGAAETTTLTEGLAIDLAELAARCVPQLGDAAIRELRAAATAGITRRMALAGRLVHDRLGPQGAAELATHPSDTVRGVAAFALGARDELGLADLLAAVRPLADDHHFGVREWAWLAIRPRIAKAPLDAIALLADWTADPAANVRRFASEATRPRGVWCAHIGLLKAEPALGLPVLEPLRDDDARYVQESVGNWLNDAAKTQPAWVRERMDRWSADTTRPVAPRIARQALRSLKPG
ncbi:MAG: HEAT repeat domain-containing protein [Pseudomonadota bacterium]